MREEILLNQGSFTVEVHTQLRNALRNSERKNSIRNHPLIHATLIISVMNVTVGNQIHASDVEDHFVENFPKQYTSDKKFHCNTEKPKTRTYRSKKYIRHQKIVQIKSSHGRYMLL